MVVSTLLGGIMEKRRLVLVARPLYGARNAFAALVSALEDSGVLSSGRVKLVFTEDNPLGIVKREKEKGNIVVVLYGVSSPIFLDVIAEIRRVSKEAYVVVGGPHAEGAYWQFLRLGAYAAVVGDGENAIVGLVEHFIGHNSLESVPNIAYYSNGVFRVTRIENIELDSYRPHAPSYELYPPIEIMRGCPYHCKFCQVPWLFKSSVRFRSPERVALAARDYVRVGRKRIRFVAPIGFAYMSKRLGEPNTEAIEKLLVLVRQEGGEPYLGTFPSEVRPEYIREDVLKVVRRYAANKRISVGLQSGDNRVLRLVGREHTIEDALQAVELIIRHGFQPIVDIIFGLPGEDEEAVENTIKVMYYLAERRVRLRLHTFIPLPGTPFARERPHGIHPKYHEAVRRLLGRGVIEGDWREQEEVARIVYCVTAYDPLPTRERKPLEGEREYCVEVWKLLDKVYDNSKS